jgi:hypothetical protein
MRLHEYLGSLIESAFPLDGVDYLIDPSMGQVQALLAKSQRKLVRGLVGSQGQFIVWDAYAKTHEDAQVALTDAGLIQRPVYLIAISKNVIVTYSQDGEHCDPRRLVSEPFQQFLGRAIRNGYRMPGAQGDPTRMNESWVHGILHNPSTNALRNLLDAVQSHIVKGHVNPDTGEFWCGSGFHHTHGDIAAEAHLDESLWPFVIAESREPGRYGVALISPGQTYTTNQPHEGLKRLLFFRLPQIARLNWADVQDRTWREVWA